MIEEETRTSGSSVENAYIAHDPAGLPVMIQTSTGTVALYVYDGRNNPVGLLTDFSSTAYVYSVDPYGTATLTSTSGGSGVPENPYLYGGGLQDRATGHLKFGARWYDPTAGTWTQQDGRNTPLDPHNANRYQYAASDPINDSDPSGKCSLWEDPAGYLDETADRYLAAPLIAATSGLLIGVGVASCATLIGCIPGSFL